MNRTEYLEGLLKNSDEMWAKLAKIALPSGDGCTMLDALRKGADAYKATEIDSADTKRAADLEKSVGLAGERREKSVEETRAAYMEAIGKAKDFERTVELGSILAHETETAQLEHDAKVAGFQASILSITESKRIAADLAFIEIVSPGTRKNVARVSVSGILYCRKLGYDFWLDDGVLYTREKSSIEDAVKCGPLTITSLTMFGKYAREVAGYLKQGNDAVVSLDRTEKVAAHGNLRNAGGVAGIAKVGSVGDTK